MNRAIALTALATMLAATPASAMKVVLTGDATMYYGGGGTYFAGLPVPWPTGGFLQGTKYTASITLSRPALSVQLSYHENACFVAYDGIGGFGSDCLDNWFLVGASNSRTAFGSFVTGKDYSDVFINDDGYEQGIEEFYDVDSGIFDNEFASDDPVGYRIVLYDSVPEPASWAMMIAGFGLVGGGLRTRRRALAA